MYWSSYKVITNRNVRLSRDEIIHDLEVMINADDHDEVYKRYGDIRAKLDQLCEALLHRTMFNEYLDKKRREYQERMRKGGETIDSKDRS